MKNVELRVSAPGRMCLFGEHQDYFGLAIIAAAINLRIAIGGSRRTDTTFVIDMPDIGEKEEFSFDREIPYEKKRDYLKSAVNIHRRAGLPLTGWDCEVRGTIPINAGTSSSSALVVAWNKFLSKPPGRARRKNPTRSPSSDTSPRSRNSRSRAEKWTITPRPWAASSGFNLTSR